MSANMRSTIIPEHAARANVMRERLYDLVKEEKLSGDHVDLIIQESIKNNFNDVASATDETISYTGWLSVTSVGGGGYVFSSWGGNFSMSGWLAPAVGVGFFFYARVEIFKKYDFDLCKGYISFQVTPVAMSMNLSMDDHGNIPVGGFVAGGPALAVGAGMGDFNILKK